MGEEAMTPWNRIGKPSRPNPLWLEAIECACFMVVMLVLIVGA